VTSTLPVPFTRSMQALRVTMDSSTGNVTFYTGTAISGSFARLGAVNSGTGGAATSIAVNHGSPLVVGWSLDLTPPQLRGRVAEYKLWNGIGGTVAADGVFSAQSAGAATWTDSAGNAWNVQGGAEISARDYRWHGQLSALPPTWDETGADVAVKITSGAVLRQLGQGSTPTQSPMRRAEALQTGTLAPVAYWACEDAAGAQSFGSAIGGTLLAFNGSPTLASDTSFACSAALPKVNNSRWYGQVPRYTSNGSIVVRFLMNLSTPPASGAVIMRLITTGTATEVQMYSGGSGNLGLKGLNSSGTVFDTGVFAFGLSAIPVWMSIELTPSGGNVTYTLVSLQPGASSGAETTPAAYAGSTGNINAVYVGPNGDVGAVTIGHISVQSAWVSLFSLAQPLNAWTGELAGNRFTRVLGENGIAARVLGSVAVTAPMGAQPVDTILSILQECESCDRGLIYEPPQCYGLAYRTLASMLNQAPVQLDYSQATLGGGGTKLEPTYDDKGVINDETVTRGSPSASSSMGAVYRYQLNDGSAMSVTGIGDYDNSDTVNCQMDTAVPHLASWIVHVGTVDQARWPAVPVNLARTAIQSNSLYYPMLGLDAGDYLQLLNMLGVITADPVSQVIPGTKETLGGFHHAIDFNAIPESCYEVIVLDDATRGRVDTDGSQLTSSITSAATSMSVTTTGPSGIVWTQAAADMPFDVAVGGERMTVTAVSGSTSPQTFTVTRSVNGVVKSQPAATDVRLWLPPILSLI
jgi:hypothetical protein